MKRISRKRLFILLAFIVLLVPVAVEGLRLWELAHPVAPVPEYMGKSYSAILVELGTPIRTDDFKLSQALDEMRISLLGKVPSSTPADREQEIRELTWLQGRYYLTIWLARANNEWVVVDGVRWHKDVRF